jgi:hypothetical protein
MPTLHTQHPIRSRWLCALLVIASLLSACGGGGASVPAPPALPKAWGTAAAIDVNTLGYAFSAQIAVNASGSAVAVWLQSDGARDNLWANRYTPTSGWGTATLIEIDNLGDAFAPQIAIDANGNAMAVWTQSDGTRDNVWVNRFTPAGGWGTATLIETNNVGGAEQPQIAMDTSGNALAVWSQVDGSYLSIWANRYTPTGGWGTASLIESGNAGPAFSPQIAFDTSGNAMAVRMQADSLRYNIVANRFTPSGGWGTASLIETDNAGNAENPQIAFDASGNAMAVWQQTDGTRTNIWANRYTASTGWSTATLIETDNAGPAIKPQIALDSSGNAIAVWSQRDSTRSNIWANRFTPSGGWGTATLIETDNAGSAFVPQIAMDASGNAWAVWEQGDGTRYSIRANAYR